MKTKNDIVDSLAVNLGTSKAEAKRVLEAVLEEVKSAVKDSGITLHGFGTFKVKDRPARLVRNPSTGEKSEKAADRKVTFRAAPALLEKN